jgi:hypothetical protein
MRNSQSLSIVVTMIVTFSLSFAFMWNRRPQGQSGSESTLASTSSPIPEMTPAPVPVPSRTSGRHREPPTIPVGAQTSAAGSPANQMPVAQALPAMPVALNIGHNQRHNTTEASMVSLSESPVSIQISIVNPSTQHSSNLQIELAPHSQQYVGTTEGVELNSGDEVTLKNPSYQDLTQRVP